MTVCSWPKSNKPGRWIAVWVRGYPLCGQHGHDAQQLSRVGSLDEIVQPLEQKPGNPKPVRPEKPAKNGM